VDLRELQSEARTWRNLNFPAKHSTAIHQTLGVAEEVGELCHAVLKMEQGIRGDQEKHMLDAEDAIGDIIIYLTGVCDNLSLRLEDCVDQAWSRVSKRDWVEDPEKGGEEEWG
jgi:NTP pyrophosphatase (non-canonical NTP hydrolase)